MQLLNIATGIVAAAAAAARGAAALEEQIPMGLFGPEAVSPARQPNIVFIITDDQDLHMQSLDYLPFVKKHLRDRGTLYKRHFCTTALCCPSRVSLWTGKQAHNTNVTDVNPPYGGYPKFVSQGLNEAYLPVWLQEAGYNTYYTGKLFNAHTVENYNAPYAAGWTGSDFLLDPFTYQYLNASYQRNKDKPVSYEGKHSVDVLAEKANGFLEDAVAEYESKSKPFFLGIAPVAPHSNVVLDHTNSTGLPGGTDDIMRALFSPPIPAERHAHLFPDAKVPRTAHFNPENPSGANWVRRLPRQSDENVEFNDHFYRQRLRALQSVDELVDGLLARLEQHPDVLENTYFFYTTDNGYHIGQHRLQPGKECGFEEDINIPLIIRGPGVPEGVVANDVVTTHVDLAPTILDLAGAPSRLRADFDGETIPLNKAALEKAVASRHEHVTVEYWGFAAGEGDYFEGDTRLVLNNTYKALRIISSSYDLYYSVWCSNERELYDLKTDPLQLHNLLHEDSKQTHHSLTLLGLPLHKVVARLDSLLLVLKSCKGQSCVRPWQALHPAGNVANLHDALATRYDDFYEVQQRRVGFSRCELGYILDAEGPQFERDGLVYRHGARWDEWV